MTRDPAEARIGLIHERNEARRTIGMGALALTSVGAALWLAAHAGEVALLVVTFYLPCAFVLGAKWLASGLSAHAVASLQLRRLHARDTGLPPARLL